MGIVNWNECHLLRHADHDTSDFNLHAKSTGAIENEGNAGRTSDCVYNSIGKHVRNSFLPIVIILLLLMVGGHGCARQEVVAPDRKPPAPASPEAIPSVPSKDTGMKKRMPVTVKTGDRLGWVENALTAYPPDRFLTGLGMAPDRKTAERRSLTELEKPFALSISGRTRMQIEALGKFPESLDRETHKLAVKCQGDALKAALSHGRVADVFIEKTPTATFYALAVLDRHVCVNQLRPLIAGMDRQLKEWVNRFEKADVTMPPADGYALTEAFLCREALDAALAAATPGGNGEPLPVQPKTIGRLLRKK